MWCEPFLEECYSFTKFVDEENQQNLRGPLQTYVPPNDARCAHCDQPAPFCWLPGEVRRDGAYAYQAKEQFDGYQWLCGNHLREVFMEATRRKKFHYMEYWPSQGDEDGYCD